MIDAIKKTLLAGVGAAVITKEKVEVLLDELVAQGKLSATEARTLARRLARDGKREFADLSEDVSVKLADLVKRSAGEAQTRLKDFEARLRRVEREASQRARPQAKPARRKRAPRRRSA
jgi:polyhydroxyalkanoate synthesis regulator phasin